MLLSHIQSKSEEKTINAGFFRRGKTQNLEMTLKSELEAKIQVLKMQAIRALRGDYKEGLKTRRVKKPPIDDEIKENSVEMRRKESRYRKKKVGSTNM